LNIFVKSNSFIAFLAAGSFIAWFAACGNYSASHRAKNGFRVDMQSIELDPEEPTRVGFDRLRLLGAYRLTSNNPRFGGLSGLAAGSDGRLYAVSDRGFWLSARMHLHDDGRLLDLTNWQTAPLLTPSKGPVAKLLTDAEALAQAPNRSFVVGFEHAHRLWRYAAPPETLASAAVPIALPSEISKAPSNGGLEAVSVRPDGRIFAIAEWFENPDGSSKAWLLNNGHSAELSYLPETGFRTSDAAALGNGDVLVLERRYRFPIRFSARLALVKARDIKPGAALKGEEIARFEPPLNIDNFEGVAVKETREGTMIFMVSDDNYFFLQRTLLLQFLLPRAGKSLD
jgi:hypothetical protein